jgi:ATP-dependent helicase/nuclease subunit B
MTSSTQAAAGHVPVQVSPVPAGRSFWSHTVARLREFAAQSAGGDLSALWVIAPRAPLLAGLRDALREGDGVVAAPRALALADLLPEALARFGPAQFKSELACRAELYAVLRRTSWLAEAAGGAAELWQLAGDLRALVDELLATQAADPDGEFSAAARSVYAGRAWSVLSQEAQLVAAVLAAVRSDAADPLNQRSTALRRLAQASTAPLVLLPRPAPLPDFDLLRAHWAGPVLDLQLHWPAQPPHWVTDAWPEILGAPGALGAESAEPLAARAPRFASNWAAQPAQLISANSLEDEALAAAGRVEAALRGGCRRVAIVALDRLVARRTRALLERAQILVADEAGWKLSTTAAAAALMRWYDVVMGEARWVDLLDWLAAPAVFSDDAAKPAALEALESTLRAQGVQGGWKPIERALRAAAAQAAPPAPPGLQRALQWIEALAPLARRTRQAAQWASHADALAALDQAVGLRAGLAHDAAGVQVLAQWQRLLAELIPGRYTLTEWRAVLADALEQSEFVDRTVDSPVAMLSLAGTWLRHFDAVVLVGADARHLPAPPPTAPLLSPALRRELHLRDASALRRESLVVLASVLASGTEASFTWQARQADADNPESGWLARLRALAVAAGAPEPVQPAAAVLAPLTRQIESHGAAAPAPRAADLLPARISAAAYADLVACPYRYFALRMAGLAALDDIDADPAAHRVGQAVHRALQRWHQAALADAAAATAERLRVEIDAAFAPLVEELPSYLAARRQWQGWAAGYVEWQQAWAAKGFHFERAEVAVERRVVIHSREVTLVGRLDRIDDWLGGQAVLDYKTTADVAGLKRQAAAPTEHPQLAFYAALLEPPPAWVGYVALRAAGGKLEVDTSTDPAELAEQLRTRLIDQLTRIAQGSVLPAHGLTRVCERCEGRGLCRRAYRLDEAA